jgi:bleomycin hydrolase
MGAPPVSFKYANRRYTPKQFAKKMLRLAPEEYVEVMSTLKSPFYSKAEFEAPDNWWHSKDYHNLPLDEFYGLLKKAIAAGHTVAIGGDVSEPGKQGEKDVALIPSYDIRAEDIDQSAREYRISNGSTADDHLVHLVGFVHHAGHDWFLAKDSARSARLGPNKGYYFFRADFIKLKMLTYTVHRDILKPLLPKFR